MKHESPVAKMFISAFAAWGFELFVGHYIEVLKISKQTSGLSYARITKELIANKALELLTPTLSTSYSLCFVNILPMG